MVWLAFVLPKGLSSDPATNQTNAGNVRTALAGLVGNGGTLAIGLAPSVDIPGYDAFNQGTDLPPRTLNWSLVTQDAVTKAVQTIALEVQADTSNGGRNPGVALLRLPSVAAQIAPPVAPNNGDPMYAGTGGMPPELPVTVTSDRVVMWLTLSCADEPALALAYLAVNAAAIIAQVTVNDERLAVATGAGDASFTLSHSPVAPSSSCHPDFSSFADARHVDTGGQFWRRWAQRHGLCARPNRRHRNLRRRHARQAAARGCADCRPNVRLRRRQRWQPRARQHQSRAADQRRGPARVADCRRNSTARA